VGLGTGSEILWTDLVSIVIGPGRIVSASELVSSVYGWLGTGSVSINTLKRKLIDSDPPDTFPFYSQVARIKLPLFSFAPINFLFNVLICGSYASFWFLQKIKIVV
jgi:hypothetical protein